MYVTLNYKDLEIDILTVWDVKIDIVNNDMLSEYKSMQQRIIVNQQEGCDVQLTIIINKSEGKYETTGNTSED